MTRVSIATPISIAPPAENRPRTGAGQTRLVLLGTGNPNADPDRSGPALAIVVRDQAYLIDCGPGLVRRAAAMHRAGIAALDVRRLTKLFVTHLHSDHTAGYPDLILTPWVLGRNEPLAVYGPPGIRAMTKHLRQAYAADINLRIHGLEGADPRGIAVRPHEIRPGVIYRDQQLRVRAFRVPHGSCRQAFGFRFETADRAVVISGDTRPTAAIARHTHPGDVLVHEVYCQAAFDRLPRRWRRYHASFHTAAPQLGRLAARIRPGLLVLCHQLLWGASVDELLAEIRREYSGPVAYGADQAVY